MHWHKCNKKTTNVATKWRILWILWKWCICTITGNWGTCIKKLKFVTFHGPLNKSDEHYYTETNMVAKCIILLTDITLHIHMPLHGFIFVSYLRFLGHINVYDEKGRKTNIVTKCRICMMCTKYLMCLCVI